MASTCAQDDVVESLLRQFGLFGGLPSSDLKRLACAVAFRSMERGEVVIDYGGSVNEIHCVLSGMVKLLVRSGRRKERIFELAGSGSTFGEGLVFSGQPSPGRVVAIEDGRLLTVPAHALAELLKRSPGFALRLLRRVSQRMGRLLAELESDTAQSSAQRIVGWLVAQIDPAAAEPRIRLEVSKATLAALLNTTPETFSRVLQHLRRQGVVRVARREIVVLSPERLRLLKPCVFCSKPFPASFVAPTSIWADDEAATWRAESEVPHWFGDCDCDVPHWCARAAQSLAALAESSAGHGPPDRGGRMAARAR
jgi:CRP-like cAMP-binding protein